MLCALSEGVSAAGVRLAEVGFRGDLFASVGDSLLDGLEERSGDEYGDLEPKINIFFIIFGRQKLKYISLSAQC